MTIEADDKPPRDFRGLRDLMLSEAVKLPKRLQQVANFAMSHPDEIAFGTAVSIAEQAQVQPSALVRFSQAIGYSGFSQLQEVFRERLRERRSNYSDRLDALRETSGEELPGAVLLDGCCEASGRSIEALRGRIDLAAMDAAAHRLAAAETIYLIAQRRSFPVSAYLNYAFGQLDIKTVLIGSAAGTDAETLSFATSRDAAIAVSFTPYAPATLTHVRQLAASGAPVVAITDNPFSPLVSSSAFWFEVIEADYKGFRSLSATMTLAMSLALVVAEIRRKSKK